MMKNPKTTLTGIAMILGGISAIINELVSGAVNIDTIKVSIGAIVTGAGLIMASDGRA